MRKPWVFRINFAVIHIFGSLKLFGFDCGVSFELYRSRIIHKFFKRASEFDCIRSLLSNLTQKVIEFSLYVYFFFIKILTALDKLFLKVFLNLLSWLNFSKTYLLYHIDCVLNFFLYIFFRFLPFFFLSILRKLLNNFTLFDKYARHLFCDLL